MGRLFGTDGIRGVANERLSVDLAVQVAQAAGTVIREKMQKKPVFIIGKDTRLSSDMLEAAMAAGLCAAGCDVWLLGVLPTPGVSHLVTQLKADAGVMLTASHNPFEDNGIKIIGPGGMKLSDAEEQEIEEIVLDKIKNPHRAKPAEVGSITKIADAAKMYTKYLQSLSDSRLDGLRVAIDCANGCASVSAEQIFSGLGAECFVLHNKPDGVNVNQNCGSTHMQDLCRFVKENRCDLGVAFDGDADRCLAVDENGEIVNGDELMAMFALDYKKQGKLQNGGLVVTVMSNLGLFQFAKEHEIDAVITQVGDRYVLEKMIQDRYSVGGEQSGHIIFLDDMRTGDGQLSALRVMNLMVREKKPLSELKSVMKNFPQVLVNITADDERKAKLSELDDWFCALNETLGENGRILVRASGTEPLIRVMIEGESLEEIQKLAEQIGREIVLRLN